MSKDLVSVGEMLVLREEFWQCASKESLPASSRLRADALVRALDELIERRRLEGQL